MAPEESFRWKSSPTEFKFKFCWTSKIISSLLSSDLLQKIKQRAGNQEWEKARRQENEQLRMSMEIEVGARRYRRLLSPGAALQGESSAVAAVPSTNCSCKKGGMERRFAHGYVFSHLFIAYWFFRSLVLSFLSPVPLPQKSNGILPLRNDQRVYRAPVRHRVAV